MNVGDIVKITKIIEQWNDSSVQWPERITQSMIDNGLYGVYRQVVSNIGIMVKIKNSFYYFPEESLELVENGICVHIVQKPNNKWYFMNFQKVAYLNENFETVSKVNAVCFDTAPQAEIYLKENLVVLASPGKGLY